MLKIPRFAIDLSKVGDTDRRFENFEIVSSVLTSLLWSHLSRRRTRMSFSETSYFSFNER